MFSLTPHCVPCVGLIKFSLFEATKGIKDAGLLAGRLKFSLFKAGEKSNYYSTISYYRRNDRKQKRAAL